MLGVLRGSKKREARELEIVGEPPPEALAAAGLAPKQQPSVEARRMAAMDRVVTKFIDVAIAKPDMLRPLRKLIDDHWKEELRKNPKLDIHRFQRDYDLGCMLAAQAHEFAKGLVETLIPEEPSAPIKLSKPGDAEPKLQPHVGKLDPGPEKASA